MKTPYIVDTNVLIAASAVDMNFPYPGDAEPPDVGLRKKIYDWLDRFSLCSSCILILDSKYKIYNEYNRKLRPNHFGLRVVEDKIRTQAVELVPVDYDKDGHAILDDGLQNIVDDNADRKMVAAALKAKERYGTCTIAFGADSDWHGWQGELEARGLALEPLILEHSWPIFLKKEEKKQNKQKK